MEFLGSTIYSPHPPITSSHQAFRQVSPRARARHSRVIDSPISHLESDAARSLLNIEVAVSSFQQDWDPSPHYKVYLPSPVTAWDELPSPPVPRYRNPISPSPSPCPKGKVPVLKLESLESDPTQQRWIRKCVSVKYVNKKREEMALRRKKELKDERLQFKLLEEQRRLKDLANEEQAILSSVNKCIERVDDYMIIIKLNHQEFEAKKSHLLKVERELAEMSNRSAQIRIKSGKGQENIDQTIVTEYTEDVNTINTDLKQQRRQVIKEMINAKDRLRLNLSTANNILDSCTKEFKKLQTKKFASKKPRTTDELKDKINRNDLKIKLTNLSKIVKSLFKFIDKEEKVRAQAIERASKLSARKTSESRYGSSRQNQKTSSDLSKLHRRLRAAKSSAFDWENMQYSPRRPKGGSDVSFDGDLIEEVSTPKEEYGYGGPGYDREYDSDLDVQIERDNALINALI